MTASILSFFLTATYSERSDAHYKIPLKSMVYQGFGFHEPKNRDRMIFFMPDTLHIAQKRFFRNPQPPFLIFIDAWVVILDNTDKT